jgi:hypothetical protein
MFYLICDCESGVRTWEGHQIVDDRIYKVALQYPGIVCENCIGTGFFPDRERVRRIMRKFKLVYLRKSPDLTKEAMELKGKLNCYR